MTTRVCSVTCAVLAVAAIGAGVSAQSTLASLFDTYTVTNQWAKLSPGQTFEASTSSVAADGKGSVIVLVRAAPYFRVFSRDGQPVKQWGDAGLFALAHSVHVAPDGAIWASDPNAHAVYRFSPEGALLMTLGTKGTAGDNASRTSFNEPNAVTVAANGDIYVSDGYQNARVVQFTKDGTFVKIIGGTQGSAPGELDLPHGVAVDPQGRIIVADSDNTRLSIFDRDGRFVKTIATPCRGNVVATADGTIYASDVNAGAVTVLRNDRIVDVIKVEGRPHGLTVDPATGDVYTSSTTGKQWNVTKASPKPAAAR
jgi:DNA-binding beta-propeller fold protein YncE